MWVWSDDPIAQSLVKAAGGKGVPMGVPRDRAEDEVSGVPSAACAGPLSPLPERPLFSLSRTGAPAPDLLNLPVLAPELHVIASDLRPGYESEAFAFFDIAGYGAFATESVYWEAKLIIWAGLQTIPTGSTTPKT